jgi:twitching motility protein PilT
VADIDKFLVTLHKHNGSDLHLTADAPPALRLHGVLTTMKIDPLPSAQVMRLFDQVMPKETRARFMETGDADFSYELGGVGRFRCNVLLGRKGVGGIFRYIAQDMATADQIGLPLPVLNLCGLSRGLVLVAGPASSGKSTTLAALVDFINESRKEHIVCLESPIEFCFDDKKARIIQRNVGESTMSYEAALDAVRREDANVIVIGELNDDGTMLGALDAAENGMLVLASMRAADSRIAIERIVSRFSPQRQPMVRAMLGRNLRGIIAQHLCRQKDGQGRVAAREVLLVNDEIAAMIAADRIGEIAQAMQTGAKDGQTLLNDSLVKLVMDETIGTEEALDTAVDGRDLRKKFQVAGIEVEE